jgi:hypothetical protein
MHSQLRANVSDTILMDRPRLLFRNIAATLAVLICAGTAAAQTLRLQLDADQVRLAAPDLRFISPDARQALHDGSSVTYSFRINISATRNGIASISLTYHCIFSYDIWEERFKVSRSEPGARSASHLSEEAAQKQCIESLTIPAGSLSADAPFWVSIDYQMADRQSSSTAEDQRTWLGTVVEIFSQRKEKPQSIGTIQGGPFRLSELRKK